jgi:glycosyltransferase involved in cell wall biosynthesis
MSKFPRVSIGLPVYNGENFIEKTLDAILSQTFDDFELIISDNASTDKTGQICNLYAEKDKRIRYYRNEKNLGGSKNYNRVFELSNGEYFKWAPHDDLIAPTYLERCLEVLDRDPSIVLCYSKMHYVNETGLYVKDYIERPNHCSEQPYERFCDFVLKGTQTFEHFGLVRSNILRKTSLYESYSLTDQILLAELSLYGKFFEIPETLLFIRLHPQICTVAFPDRIGRTAWFDTSKVNKLAFPHWRAISSHRRSIKKAPLNDYNRYKCYVILAKWINLNNNRLRGDITTAIKTIFLKTIQIFA